MLRVLEQGGVQAHDGLGDMQPQEYVVEGAWGLYPTQKLHRSPPLLPMPSLIACRVPQAEQLRIGHVGKVCVVCFNQNQIQGKAEPVDENVVEAAHHNHVTQE